MTSQHPHPSAPQCYTDYALQEYALERFSEGLCSDITNHLDTCATCKNALKSIEREICYFQQIEALGHEINDQNCLDDIQMASFMDAGEKHDEYPTRLTHLQQCASCRHTLIEMREEIARALAQAAGNLDEERHQSTQILTMPERAASDGEDEDELPDFAVTRSGTDT
ncbi:MAG: hypothetical protein VCD00_05325 [Candidatus Hydrogenedentota bacterium]